MWFGLTRKKNAAGQGGTMTGRRIPQTIHQIFLSDQAPAPCITRNIAKLKALNPGWQHVLHTRDSTDTYIKTHFAPEVLDAYRSINPLYGAARADCVRYLVIHREGGVYLDIKSGADRPLDQIIHPDDELLLSRWKNQVGEKFEGWGNHPDDGIASEYQSWHIIARAGHPSIESVWRAVLNNIQNYSMRKQGVGKFGVLRTTGPLAYTKALLRSLHGQPHRIFDSDASGLVYSALEFDPGQRSHKDLFKQHYTRVKLPLVSAGPQRPWHYARYKAMRWLGWMP